MHAIRKGLDDLQCLEQQGHIRDTEWASAILTKLCQIGRNEFKCKVGADTGRVDKAHRDWGEWLYDVTWLKYNNDRHDHLIDVPLVAECEWKPLDGIVEDFHKLLLARSGVRLMIYNGLKGGLKRPGSQVIAKRLAESVKKFEYRQKEDTWLLAGWEWKDIEARISRFRYFTINSEGNVDFNF